MLSYKALRVSMGQLWITLSTICQRPLDLLRLVNGHEGQTYGSSFLQLLSETGMYGSPNRWSGRQSSGGGCQGIRV